MPSPEEMRNGAPIPDDGGAAGGTPPLPAEVTAAESAEVARRRQAAGLGEPPAAGGMKENLVGLALSGGGVRSASFNLGLLQALVGSGALRFVDYLSTVSGGGYIGAFLDSLAYRRHAQRREKAEKGPPEGAADALRPIRPLDNGGQPPEVMELAAKSHYLNDTVGFVNRYLIGFVLFNLTVLSAVLFVATLVATLWRCLDTPPVTDFLVWFSGGRVLEWNRPFLPGLLLLLVWVLIWLASFVRVGTPALAHHSGKLLFCAGAFLLVGLAVWLGTPNMNFTNVLDSHFDPRQQDLKNWSQELLVPLGLLLLVALLPFLRPWQLLKSGAQTESLARQWVFKTAGLALLVGVPLALVYAVGRHNVSGVGTDWQRPLCRDDFVGWERLLAKIKQEMKELKEADPEKKAGLVTPGTLLSEWQANPTHQPGRSSALGSLLSLQEADEHEHGSALASRYQRARHNGAPWPDEVLGPWRQSYRKYVEEEHEKDEIAAAVNAFLAETTLGDKLLDNTASWRRVQDRLAELRKIPDGGKDEADRLEWLLQYAKFRSGHPGDMKEERPVGFNRNKEEANRGVGHLLLRAFYPTEFRPIRFVNRPIVIEGDQSWRWGLLKWTGLAFLVCGQAVNFNHTSMHGFYRSRLQRTFIVPTGTTARGKERDINLSDLKNTEEGLPYHLLFGSVAVASGRRLLHQRADGFLFSKLYCGSPELGFCPTARFRNGENDLSSAAAISGAAVSPLRMGNLLFQILLVATNFRLGQWLPNPGGPARRLPKFVPLLRLLPDWLVRRPTREERFVFVADGGFYENLGVEALLNRRCRVLLASDAGADPRFVFEDFARLFRRCRMQGIRLLPWGKADELTMNDVIPSEMPGRGPFSKRHRVFIRVRYPDGDEGLLIYVKLSMSDPEVFDLWQYRATHPAFPHDPTVNQFFDVDQFESYRELGYRIGAKLCEDLRVREWAPSVPITVKALEPILDELAPAVALGGPEDAGYRTEDPTNGPAPVPAAPPKG